MVKKSHSPEQVINKLREAEILLNQGANVGEASRKIGITEQTYYRWRKEYGGMRIEQAKRLKGLERENALEGLDCSSSAGMLAMATAKTVMPIANKSRKLSTAWAAMLMLPPRTATTTFMATSPITTPRASLAAPLLVENIPHHLPLVLAAGKGSH